MTERELQDISYQLSQRYTAINSKYLKEMGQHIKDIGKLTPTDIHRIEQYNRMHLNIDKCKQEIRKASGLTMKELDEVFDSMIMGEYKDNKYLYEFRNLTPNDILENVYIQQYVESIRRLTENSLTNIANTTVLDRQYQDLIDAGIYAVSNGLTDYNTAIRAHLRQASTGARVTYKSGVTRRLDSAVRMNVLDGVRNVYDEIHKQGGEMFGADGYEVSAHALCAIDHLDIQGKQYAIGGDKVVDGVLYEDFDKMDASLQRSIGTCNCHHTIFPIILGISNPANSVGTLKQYKNYSEKKIEINGREYTRYECSQLMRKAETSMRYSKDGYVLADNAGDTELASSYKRKLQRQQRAYRNIAKQADLKTNYRRTYVPGYDN